MCFGTYNHRFENMWRSKLALKLLEKLKICPTVASRLNTYNRKMRGYILHLS